jgi:hypothetical protein
MDEQKKPRRTTTIQRTGSDAAADQSDAMKGSEPLPSEKPSQAEGDRETVEQSIREHEQNGELF